MYGYFKTLIELINIPNFRDCDSIYCLPQITSLYELFMI